MSKLTDALFPKSTLAVLSTLFTRPDGLHLRGLMSATGLGSASAQRELKKLLDAGILTRKENGKVLLYQPNTDSPVYAELRSIIEKTDGVAEKLEKTLHAYASKISRAFIYGSVARADDRAGSDIDLLVITDTLGSADLYPVLLEAEQLLGRRISLTIYRPEEYRRRLEANNHFLTTVMAGPRIDLIGRDDGEQGAAEPRENRTAEAFSQSEFDTIRRSGEDRLRDAGARGLSVSSRFLLAYGAAYAFSLAALRRHGYRPANRYVVFQCLPHTLGVDTQTWRLLADAHDVRNGFEYEGSDEVTEDLCDQVIRCARLLSQSLG